MVWGRDESEEEDKATAPAPAAAAEREREGGRERGRVSDGKADDGVGSQQWGRGSNLT